MDIPPLRWLGLIIICLIIFSILPSYAQAPNKVVLTPVNLAIVQNNTLKSFITPVFISKNGTLGSLIGELDINYLISLKYPERKDLLTNLTKCESRWQHDGLWGDNYTSYGVFQFQKRTFYTHCEGNWKDAEDQLDCAVKMIDIELGPTTTGWYNCWKIMDLWQYQ